MSSSDQRQRDQTRVYDRCMAVVFLKTQEAFGGLSNMAGGFPLIVNGIGIRTSEALYQACRFPHMPEVQRLIIEQRSPMTAKMKGKPFRDRSRPDWNSVRVKIMRWCLRVKLAQNWDQFSSLLLETGDRPIVEQSRKDDFWGAKPADDDTLVGMNVLGRLLMELRECVKHEPPATLMRVEPPGIPEFLLDARPIGPVGAERVDETLAPRLTNAEAHVTGEHTPGDSLFAGVADSVQSARRTGKRPAYPAYKPSGMEWVGDVPEHWETHRLKHIASVRFSSVDKHTKEDEEPVRLCNYVDVYYNDFIREGLDFMAATATRSEIERFQLRHGDVLITKDSEAWDDIAVPAYVAEELDGVLCGYHLAHIRPDLRNVLGEYLFRAFRSRGVNDQFRVAANGITRFGLSKYWLENGLFPVPPLNEQKTIAAFLDRETARIDALIEKKRRQIELLQEKRSALISHAVTKGLDPNALIKDSGIEWLGKVPAHWDVLRLKRIASISNGSTPSRENMEYWTNGCFPWLNSSVVNQIRVMEGSDFVTDLALRECHLPRLSPPTVVVGITGEGKTRGMATVVEIECTINQHLAFIKPNDGAANAAYIRNLFLPLYDFLRRESSGGGSTKGAITCEQLANLKIPCPPVHEQADIVDRIDRGASQTNTLLMKVERSIDLLREHRSALISAGVTGKIDVRGEIA